MLQVRNPSKRADLGELLSHPWLVEVRSEGRMGEGRGVGLGVDSLWSGGGAAEPPLAGGSAFEGRREPAGGSDLSDRG